MAGNLLARTYLLGLAHDVNGNELVASTCLPIDMDFAAT